MSATRPFGPSYGTNQVLTATGSSQTATIAPGNKQLRILNLGSNKAYIKAFNSYSGTVTATTSTADFCIGAGMASTITISEYYDSVAYISASGTTLDVMTGEGW